MKFTTIGEAKRLTGLSYLGNTNSSAKIEKNKKVNQMTYVLYLAPSDLSGYNVCPNATNECKKGCLNTSGRARVESYIGKTMIIDARIKKTKLFFEHNQFFMDWLVAEIKQAKNKAEKNGFGFSVRLNGTSDIHWQETGIFDIFSDVQFYDYTKNPTKFFNKAKNYHLTFSYTGYNWSISERLLKQGFNVAVIFNIKKESELPETYKGYSVVNGDLTDYRPNDGNGVIVGLKWKKIANKENNEYVRNSKFVIQQNDTDCKYNVQNNELKIAI